MLGLSADAYLWWKWGHIIAVVCWMAGIFYLPRLYVYHAMTKVGSETSETFKVMERKLLRGIMHPSLIAAVVTGSVLVVEQENPWAFWVEWKIALGVCMVLYNIALARWRKVFERDANTRPHTFYRVINEIPTIILLAIVYFAVLKPV